MSRELSVRVLSLFFLSILSVSCGEYEGMAPVHLKSPSDSGSVGQGESVAACLIREKADLNICSDKVKRGEVQEVRFLGLLECDPGESCSLDVSSKSNHRVADLKILGGTGGQNVNQSYGIIVAGGSELQGASVPLLVANSIQGLTVKNLTFAQECMTCTADTISMVSSKKVLIEDVIVRGGKRGILAFHTVDLTIRNNLITETDKTGIHVGLLWQDHITGELRNPAPVSNVKIHHNVIRDNYTEGMFISGNGIEIRGNIVLHNHFKGNYGYQGGAIWLKNDLQNLVLSENIIGSSSMEGGKNTHGIEFHTANDQDGGQFFADNIHISNNKILDLDGYGIVYNSDPLKFGNVVIKRNQFSDIGSGLWHPDEPHSPQESTKHFHKITNQDFEGVFADLGPLSYCSTDTPDGCQEGTRPLTTLELVGTRMCPSQDLCLELHLENVGLDIVVRSFDRDNNLLRERKLKTRVGGRDFEGGVLLAELQNLTDAEVEALESPDGLSLQVEDPIMSRSTRAIGINSSHPRGVETPERTGVKEFSDRSVVWLTNFPLPKATTVEIFDSDGTLWVRDHPVTVAQSSSTFTLPKINPPSRCNIQRSCLLTYRFVFPTGESSSEVTFVLPKRTVVSVVSGQPGINLPLDLSVTGVGVVPRGTQWLLWITGEGLLPGAKLNIIDNSGNQWVYRGDLTVGPNFSSYRLPSVVPPNLCNSKGSCNVQMQVLAPWGGISESYMVTVPGISR